jgi:carbon starvation protein CstA
MWYFFNYYNWNWHCSLNNFSWCSQWLIVLASVLYLFWKVDSRSNSTLALHIQKKNKKNKKQQKNKTKQKEQNLRLILLRSLILSIYLLFSKYTKNKKQKKPKKQKTTKKNKNIYNHSPMGFNSYSRISWNSYKIDF